MIVPWKRLAPALLLSVSALVLAKAVLAQPHDSVRVQSYRPKRDAYKRCDRKAGRVFSIEINETHTFFPNSHRVVAHNISEAGLSPLAVIQTEIERERTNPEWPRIISRTPKEMLLRYGGQNSIYAIYDVNQIPLRLEQLIDKHPAWAARRGVELANAHGMRVLYFREPGDVISPPNDANASPIRTAFAQPSEALPSGVVPYILGGDSLVDPVKPRHLIAPFGMELMGDLDDHLLSVHLVRRPFLDHWAARYAFPAEIEAIANTLAKKAPPEALSPLLEKIRSVREAVARHMDFYMNELMNRAYNASTKDQLKFLLFAHYRRIAGGDELRFLHMNADGSRKEITEYGTQPRLALETLGGINEELMANSIESLKGDPGALTEMAVSLGTASGRLWERAMPLTDEEIDREAEAMVHDMFDPTWPSGPKLSEIVTAGPSR